MLAFIYSTCVYLSVVFTCLVVNRCCVLSVVCRVVQRLSSQYQGVCPVTSDTSSEATTVSCQHSEQSSLSPPPPPVTVAAVAESCSEMVNDEETETSSTLDEADVSQQLMMKTPVRYHLTTLHAHSQSVSACYLFSNLHSHLTPVMPLITLTATYFRHCFISVLHVVVVMSPLRRHIFVCFMAKSAFWKGFSALAPYTGVRPI